MSSYAAPTFIATTLSGAVGGADSVSAGSYISVGTNPAATGTIRLAKDGSITVRNQANSADLTIVSQAVGADNILVGDLNSAFLECTTGGNTWIRGNGTYYFGCGPGYSGAWLPYEYVDVAQRSTNGTIRHGQRESDVATGTLTILSSAPYASATGANRKPGDLWVATASPVGGSTSQGTVGFKVSGTDAFWVSKDASGNITLGTNGQTQTTIGAAGAASAPPASPEKYLLVTIGATTYAIPAYLAS